MHGSFMKVQSLFDALSINLFNNNNESNNVYGDAVMVVIYSVLIEIMIVIYNSIFISFKRTFGV